MDDGGQMLISMFSFGFKHGMPVADLVLDMRFLANPYWVTHLKDRSGLETDVAAHVLDDDAARKFFVLSEPFLDFLCQRFKDDKRSLLTLAVGCTGGRHRSVAVVEYLRNFLEDKGYELNVHHRDIDKM